MTNPVERKYTPDIMARHHLAPDVCFRSPLFGVFEKGKRREVKGMLVVEINHGEETKITYTGELLGQSDLDVLMYIMRTVAARKGERKDGLTRINIGEILRSISGKKVGGCNHKRIMESIDRLKQGTFKVITNKPEYHRPDMYSGSFIHQFWFSSSDKTYLLDVNDKLDKLFQWGWTIIHWHQRRMLPTDLAKWLHGYISSLRGASRYKVKLTDLQSLCGTSINRRRDFRAKIRAALTALHRVGAVVAWEIDSKDLIHIEVPAQELLPPADDCPASLIPPVAAAEPEKTPAQFPPPAAPNSSPSPPAEKNQEPPILTIPLINRDGEFAVFRADLEEWKQTFPGVDVSKHLRHCRQWNIDNPQRRKTRSGIRRHITTWLAREQDRAPGQPSPPQTTKPRPIYESGPI